MDAAAVEEFKVKFDFDSRLLDLLVPPGHRNAPRMAKPVLRKIVLNELSGLVNPHVCGFVAAGCKTVPLVVRRKKGPTRKRRFSINEPVRNFLHQFVVEAHASKLDKANARGASRRLTALVVDLIQRHKIVGQFQS